MLTTCISLSALHCHGHGLGINTRLWEKQKWPILKTRTVLYPLVQVIRMTSCEVNSLVENLSLALARMAYLVGALTIDQKVVG